MNELLNIGQEFCIVPAKIEHSNKGVITDILNNSFVIELIKEPEGLIIQRVLEFYSQTKHGTLYFNSSIAKIEGKKIVVLKPRRHRFLQRRTFTRIKFVEPIELKLNQTKITAESVDLAAGGLKLKTDKTLNIDKKYKISIPLTGGENIKGYFEPIKIEKDEKNIYTTAGKLVEISYADRMRIIQYCLRKDIEYNKR
ncbi:MAG: PilZ domain-containing protein [bacterium]|nr:PilZ domain-containing protein [bacterium]